MGSDVLLRPTWIEISRQALANNVRRIRARIGPERTLFAVVKANAYGHGAALVAPLMLAAGADRLAVAAVNEAVALRQEGVAAPILVLGFTPEELGETLVRENLAATLYDLQVAQAWSHQAQALGARIRVHVKVDTGMHRLGIYPEEALDFLAALAQLPGLTVEGLFTHFSSADEADKRYTLEQLLRLTELVAALADRGLRPPLVHAANSAATLTVPTSHLDGVRCGIALYGLHPSPETRLDSGFQPVLSWKARVAQVKRLEKGAPVSYNRTYVAPAPRMVAVVPVGYADGFPRAPRTWGHVLVHGRPAPILGRVCMDQTVVDVSEHFAAGQPVARGDEVVLIGRQGDAALSAEAVAERLATINYDVVSRILPRVPRVLGA